MGGVFLVFCLKSTEEFKRLSLQFHCDTKMLQIHFALLFGCSACGKSDSAATSVWITGRKKSFLCRLCYHNFNPDFILLGLCCVYSILWSDPWPFYVLYCHADGTRPPPPPTSSLIAFPGSLKSSCCSDPRSVYSFFFCDHWRQRHKVNSEQLCPLHM